MINSTTARIKHNAQEVGDAADRLIFVQNIGSSPTHRVSLLNWLISRFWRFTASRALRQLLRWRSLNMAPPDQARTEQILNRAVEKLRRDRFHIEFGAVSLWNGITRSVFAVYKDGQANLSFGGPFFADEPLAVHHCNVTVGHCESGSNDVEFATDPKERAIAERFVLFYSVDDPIRAPDVTNILKKAGLLEKHLRF